MLSSSWKRNSVNLTDSFPPGHSYGLAFQKGKLFVQTEAMRWDEYQLYA